MTLGGGWPAMVQSAVALCAIQAQGAGAPKAAVVSLRSLLAEMLDRDAAARRPDPAYTCKQVSSTDERTKTPADPAGWFANDDWSHFRRAERHPGGPGRPERTEWVLLDGDGPGCIVRFWHGGRGAKGSLRFYVDDSDDPVIEGNADKVCGGDAVVGAPFSAVRSRGLNWYLPVPYAKHVKVTYDGPNVWDTGDDADSFWYNLEYRTYAAGTRVESLTKAGLADAKDIVERTGRALCNPLPPKPARSPRPVERKLPPGKRLEMTFKGPGCIRMLRLRVDAEDIREALRRTVLSMDCDGERTVWCPVGDFYGTGIGLNPYKTWWQTVERDGTMTCLWPMPFGKSCKVGLENLGEKPVTVALACLRGKWTWDARSMHFRANWHSKTIPTRPMSDFNYIAAKGKGVYMGDSLALFNPSEAWWGEGDERIYVDGERFPSHLGTGSEDYYGYAWSNNGFFEAPFHAQPHVDGPGNKGHTTVTRTRILDAIPFRRSLRMDLEVWHWADVDVTYAPTSYWYALPGAIHNRPPAPDEALAAIQPSPRAFKVKDAIECETMEVLAKAEGVKVGTQDYGLSRGEFSGGAHLFVQAQKPGDFVTLRIPADGPGPRKLTLYATKSWDYGILRFTIDGKRVEKDFDFYNARAVTTGPIELGVFQPMDGAFEMRVEVVGGNPASKGARSYFGLDCVVLSKPTQARPGAGRNTGRWTVKP